MRRCSVCVSSWLAMIEAFVSLRRGACQPETQVCDLIVTEPDGSATSKMLERASRMKCTESCVAAGRCSVCMRGKLQGLDSRNAACVKRTVFWPYFGRERTVEGGWWDRGRGVR